MTPQQLFDDFAAGFESRKFSAGLLLAFIDFYSELGVPGSDTASFDALLQRFPRVLTTSNGKRANTLIVQLPDGRTQSLRPFYNAAERLFRADHHRFGYPSCAPHATQAWQDYRPWLEAMTGFSVPEMVELRTLIVAHVLRELPSQAFDPASVRKEPALFQRLLEDFPMTAQRREPTGAAFQGLVFGFLRADNPHLQVEIDKVRTGSKRLQRVGDIDGWEGARLAISAEVKQFELKPDDAVDLAGFGNATGQRGALGLVIALGFRDGTREAIQAMGLKPLDSDDLLRIVELWDPLKQRTAVASFVYYAKHVEKNAELAARIDRFLDDAQKLELDP